MAATTNDNRVLLFPGGQAVAGSTSAVSAARRQFRGSAQSRALARAVAQLEAARPTMAEILIDQFLAIIDTTNRLRAQRESRS